MCHAGAAGSLTRSERAIPRRNQHDITPDLSLRFIGLRSPVFQNSNPRLIEIKRAVIAGVLGNHVGLKCSLKRTGVFHEFRPARLGDREAFGRVRIGSLKLLHQLLVRCIHLTILLSEPASPDCGPNAAFLAFIGQRSARPHQECDQTRCGNTKASLIHGSYLQTVSRLVTDHVSILNRLRRTVNYRVSEKCTSIEFQPA